MIAWPWARPHGATLALGALLAGLVAGPPVAAVAAGAVLLTAPLWPRATLAALLAAALCLGALAGQARTRALDRTWLAPLRGHALRAEVTLLETPRDTALGWRAAARLRGERVLLRAPGGAPQSSAGEVMAVAGVLRAPGPRDGWLRPRGMLAVLHGRSVRATGRRRGGAAGVLDAVRRRAQRALQERLPPPEGALLRGMVLGDDALLAIAERDRMRRAGLGHLVAASGANVALLAALVLALSALLGLGRRTRLLAVLALIGLYVPLAGAGPSIQRAGVMGAASVAAMLASRPTVRGHAVLLAAVVTLALDPRAVGDPGWQLSFAAVVAIAVLAAPLKRRIMRLGLPTGIADGAALTVAATLGTAPVSAAAFGTVSPAGLPANVLAAPLVAPVTWLGMAAACLAQIAPGAGALTAMLAALPSAAILAIGRFAAALPAAQVHTDAAVVTPLALAAALAIAWPASRRRAPMLVGVAVLIAAVVIGALSLRPRPLAAPPPGVMRVAFLDVGQGDATLIQSGRHALLVDSGPPDGHVLARLRHLGIRRLDVLAGTHAQADHIGGAAAVLGALRVGAVLDGRDGLRDPQGDAMARAAAAAGTPLVPAAAGQTVRVGAVRADILWPPRRAGRPVAGVDPNQRAIVMLVHGGGTRLLLTADAESDVLAPIAAAPVDMLKVSHHGSADPGLPALLGRIRPRLAVIEVGRRNGYGHPTAATLGDLRRAGATVRRTDRDGTVVVDALDGRLRVHTHS